MIKKLIYLSLAFLVFVSAPRAQQNTVYPGSSTSAASSANTTTVYGGDADGDTTNGYFNVWSSTTVQKPGFGGYFFVFTASTTDPNTTDSMYVERYVAPDKDPGSNWEASNIWHFCQRIDLRNFCKDQEGVIDAGENIFIPPESLIKGPWKYEYLILYCNGSDTLTWAPFAVQDKSNRNDK